MAALVTSVEDRPSSSGNKPKLASPGVGVKEVSSAFESGNKGVTEVNLHKTG
jgi:hypothetical protein